MTTVNKQVVCDDQDILVDCEQKPKKVPRRIIHFSDGILEDYSTDEEEEPPPPAPVDTKLLSWPQYTWHYASVAFFKALAAADFCGERLAWFFGITQPKYQYYLDQYEKWKEEEEEIKRQEQEEAELIAAYEARKVATVEEGGAGEDNVPSQTIPQPTQGSSAQP